MELALGVRGRQFVTRKWEQLGTAVQMFLVLDALAVLLIAGLLIFTNRVIVHSVYTFLDNNLTRQAVLIANALEYEAYYLHAEARTTLAMNSPAMTSSPPATSVSPTLNNLLQAIHRSHEIDSIYILSQQGDVLAHVGDSFSDPKMLLSPTVLAHTHDGSTFTQLVPADAALWWMGYTPYRQPGESPVLLLFARRITTEYLQSLSRGVGAQIILTDGKVTISSFSKEYPECCIAGQVIERIPRMPVSAYFDFDYEGTTYRGFTMPLNPTFAPAIRLVLLVPKDAANAIVSTTTREILIIGVLLILVTTALVRFLVWRVFDPLRSLTAAAQGMASGDLERPIRADGTVEIVSLASSMEHMRRRILELMRAQQRWNEELEAQVRARTRELERLARLRDRLVGKLITAQEEERRRIGRELHDETSQALAYLVIRLGLLASSAPDSQTRQDLLHLKEIASSMLEDIKRIILDLRPRLLDEYGLAAAIQHYAEERLAAHGIRYTLDVRGCEYRPPPHKEINLFRIAQEAINNVVNHAQATEVRIGLECSEREIVLSVEDNGQGFDLHAVERFAGNGDYRGLGLLGMRERATLLGGDLIIESTPGKGTRVVVRVPLLEGELRHVQDPGAACR